MADPEDYECALTGSIPNEDMLVTDDDVDPENLEETPRGWVTIRVIRRGVNPKYNHIREVEQVQFATLRAQYEAELAALSPDDRARVTDDERQQRLIHLQLAAEASVLPLLQATPKYITVSAEAVVMPPELQPVVGDVLHGLLDGLDLDTSSFLPPPSPDDDEDDEGEDDR